VRFYVRDNGIGIDPQHHAGIFDVFTRLDPETEGNGIGLAIARRTVELHGGRIGVESAGRSRGSTFFVALPDRNGSDRGAQAPTRTRS